MRLGRIVVALLLTGSSVAGVGAALSPSAAAPSGTSHTRSSHWLLKHLAVGSTSHAGYERSAFGDWLAIGHGCTVRDAVLLRDAKRKPKVTSSCELVHGKWISPYDGVKTKNPTLEQIDHVVPLEKAWVSGAWRWDAATRVRFANDIGTSFDLIAASAHSNESKGDRDPSEWLPARQSFDCQYEADYIAVLWRWHLEISPSLKRFLAHSQKTCGWPNVTEPPRPAIARGGQGTSPTPTPTPTLTPTPTVTPSSPTTDTPTPTPTPTATQPQSHPCTQTSTGHCIARGQFCPQASYGQTGWDASGNQLVCTGDRTHPRWE